MIEKKIKGMGKTPQRWNNWVH